MNHQRKLTILSGLLGLVMLLALAGATPALASQQAWWNLTVGAAPTVLQPGQAKDEVQEITVSASGGTYFLYSNGPGSTAHEFPWNATDREMREGLEEILGKGTVEVLPGQHGQAGGSYEVMFKGALADRPIERLFSVSLLSGGKEEITVKETTQGRPDGRVILTLANMGYADLSGAETPITIADKLPPGLTPVGIEGIADSRFIEFSALECSLEALSCTSSGRVAPDQEIQVFIDVNVNSDAKSSGELDELTVVGGNARAARVAHALSVGDGPTSFGIEDYEMIPEEANGSIDTQAGSHPFQLTTTLDLNRNYETPACQEGDVQCGGERLVTVPELGKDLNFKAPPGLVGNPTPFPQCTLAEFLKSSGFTDECDDATAIGVANVTIRLNFTGYVNITSPLFNLTPSVGEPARFGFLAEGVPVILDTSVRTGGDYGVTVSVRDITQTATFVGSRVTFWGVPGDPRHNYMRGWHCIQDAQTGEASYEGPCNAPEAHRPPPLLELPTSCTGELQTTVEADSWQRQGSFAVSPSDVALPALDGCNRLPFTPSLSVAPDGEAGSTPTGLTVDVHLPQEVSLDGEGLGEADVRNTTVALPEGVALNPAAADGLQACSQAQVALEADSFSNCPEASKVATVEVTSPLLPNPLVGAAYLAQQNANPFGSLVAIYVVVQDPVSGTLIKLAGEVQLDPVTGQLVSSFKNTPQLPFEDFKIHFFGGARAPLVTPPLCGKYTTTSSIDAWSGNPSSTPSSTFQIVSGANDTPCSDPLPFAPSLTTGSLNIQAGALTPFTTTMSREDGNQNLQSIVLHMPPGLSGLLSGVKLCGESEANAGTCGSESEIGETIVSVGLGGDPFSVTGGKVYITGPYHGAPFGLSIVNPAKAGPYNLGQVVVRAKIEVNPITAALTISTDDSGPYKIPTILQGIPLQIKHVFVNINRPGFTFNPTNCNPMAITGSLQSTEGASRALSVPFQVTNCATLGFKPGFAVSTAGKTSRANGASLSVKLTYPKAPFGSQANIKSVKVDLPKQLPSRLTTLQKACTAAQFGANPAGCPAASIVGHATAVTPLIPVPLTGPAYFVSYGDTKFPELVVALQGYGVTLDLHGETFINKAGITSSTFHTVPDAPVGSFQLTLPQGKYSALAANGNLCKSTLKMPTAFTAQNGAEIHESTKITVTGCPKSKKTKTKKAKAHHKTTKTKRK
ncbi:MAG TPA: hypothetical protein VIJ39_08415 [Solirubrobacteraceae bacterium]